MYNRESKIMRKLLGKGAPDSTTGDLSSIAGTTTPVPTPYRPSKSRDAVYSATSPISCFDVSPDRRTVILGGPHILKTVLLDDPSSLDFTFSEGFDVRTAITTRPATGPRSNVISDQLNIQDVKWHSGSSIYTAGASGKVFSYDLTRLGAGDVGEPFEYILMHEDSRQMNSLDINPHLHTWLLTGGQDGTARVFDSKTPTPARHGITFRQRFAPLRCIDSIRQVKWSPKEGYEMACCTEGGVVMKWDVRQPARPVLRINAHEKVCSTITWHPDGVHLASAGLDTKMQVWDVSSTADKRQKPKYTISTPAPVAAIAWRPGLWSASAQARRVAQIAVTYDETSNRKYGTSAVHIWDFARPSMPYKEIESFETCPSAIAWQDQDMLWSVGGDGSFAQRDVAFARKLIDRQSTSAMAFSPRGDAMMFLDERSQSHRPRPTSQPEGLHRATYGSSLGTQDLSISRSDSEDDVLGSFLGPRRKVSRQRRQSGRGGTPLSSALSSAGGSFSDDMRQNFGLEQSVQITGFYRPQQAMSFGHIPWAISASVYQYLSDVYMDALRVDLPYVEGGKPLVDRVGVIMEKYAEAAEATRMYRLAQTWRILALGVTLLLRRRAQYHYEVRVGQLQRAHPDHGPGRLDRAKTAETHAKDGQVSRLTSGQRTSVDGRSHAVRSLLAKEIESTSNVPTPIARAVDSSQGSTGHAQDESKQHHGKKLPPITEAETFNIGPAVQGSHVIETLAKELRQRLDSQPISIGSGKTEETDASNTDGYDFYDADVLAKAIDVPGSKSHSSEKGTTVSGTVLRHDSNDSSAQMFSLSSGTKKSARMGSSGDVFARPGLIREQSEVTSGASSAEFSTLSRAMTEDNVQFPQNSNSDDAGELFMMSQTTRTNEGDQSPPSSSSRDTETDESDLPPRLVAPGGVDARPTIGTKKRAEKNSAQYRHDTRRRVVESDYLPWTNDPPYPHPLSTHEPRGVQRAPSPLDPYKLVLRALDFECQWSALSASAMVLLLGPLVPDSVIDSHRAGAILRQQHQRLMQMGLFVQAALLRNLCVQGWPEGLPDWGENYTAVFGGAQQGVKVGLFCSSCRKPREMDPAAGPGAIWTCERCRATMAPCSICGHREAERASHVPAEIRPGREDVEADTWLSQWWYCPGCAHGGHASCMQLWHGGAAENAASQTDVPTQFSDGGCPSDGCGHACLPGKYRGEMMTARSDELGRAAVDTSRAAREEGRATSQRAGPARPEGGIVRSDGNDVPQSKAVGMARETLNNGGILLGSSPGRTTSGAAGDGERRKSVKFARAVG